MGEEHKLLRSLTTTILQTHLRRVHAGKIPLGVFTALDDAKMPADVPRNVPLHWLNHPAATQAYLQTIGTPEYTVSCLHNAFLRTAHPLYNYTNGVRADEMPELAYNALDALCTRPQVKYTAPELVDAPVKRNTELWQPEQQEEPKSMRVSRAYLAMTRGVHAAIRSCVGFVFYNDTNPKEPFTLDHLIKVPRIFWEELPQAQLETNIFFALSGAYFTTPTGFLPEERLPVNEDFIKDHLLPNVTVAYNAAKKKFKK